jgi:hypothetical protein
MLVGSSFRARCAEFIISRSMRPSVPDVHITDSQDAEIAGYRALSGQAVAGLVVSLLAPVAFLAAWLWVVPLVGLVLSASGLRRIARDPAALTGRKFAWTGLVISLAVTVAAPTEWLYYRWVVEHEARQFSSLWIRCLTHDEPHKALQLNTPPRERRPLDDSLWAYYRNDRKQRESLKSYVASPVQRTLLALGPRAIVRFYETAEQSEYLDGDLVAETYAITYEEEGEKRSFFVTVHAMRSQTGDHEAGWQIVAAAPAKPEGW